MTTLKEFIGPDPKGLGIENLTWYVGLCMASAQIIASLSKNLGTTNFAVKPFFVLMIAGMTLLTLAAYCRAVNTFGSAIDRAQKPRSSVGKTVLMAKVAGGGLFLSAILVTSLFIAKP
jgi:hypothetical protein